MAYEDPGFLPPILGVSVPTSWLRTTTTGFMFILRYRCTVLYEGCAGYQQKKYVYMFRVLALIEERPWYHCLFQTRALA